MGGIILNMSIEVKDVTILMQIVYDEYLHMSSFHGWGDKKMFYSN
jgi:hypothetical protein